MQLHELVQASESIAEGCVFNTLLVGDYEVIESQQGLDTVDQEMTIAWDWADWVAEESQVHDLGERDQGLDVAPVADIIVVKIKKLKLRKSSENLGWR